MSCEEGTEDLQTPVCELSILLTDTFTCCIRNYEALLPYLEKKETKPKIYHKLVHINILLNKLNEELVGLRVEYVSVSSYETERETVLSEGGRKRKTSDGSNVVSHKVKCIKTEIPFSNRSKCSVASTSEPENLVSVDIEDTRHTKLQMSDMYRKKKNIKMELQYSDVTEDIYRFPMGNSQIAVAQKLCDTRNNRVTVQFAGNEESTCLAGRLVGDNRYDKSADTITHRENNKECVPLQNVKSETSNQERCEDSGSLLNVDQAERLYNNKDSVVPATTCGTECAISLGGGAKSCGKVERVKGRAHICITNENDDVPAQRSVEVCSIEDELYGVIETEKGRFKCKLCNCAIDTFERLHIHVKGKVHKWKRKNAKKNYGDIRYENGRYRCVLCNRKLVDYQAVLGHVKGQKHKRKQIAANKKSCAKKSEVPNTSCESKPGHVKVEKCKMKQKACKKNKCIKMPESPNKSSECTASFASCSLADTIAVVGERHQVISMIHAVMLDDMWKYFDAAFHVNKKFFRIHSGQVICYLCNEKVGRYVIDVRKHMSIFRHLHRIKILSKIELDNMSSNKQLLDIPGILKNIIPMTQFSLENKGFFCSVCDCFCENTIVLSHMTGPSHVKKLYDTIVLSHMTGASHVKKLYESKRSVESEQPIHPE